MRSPLELRSVLSAFAVVALLVACLTLSGTFTGPAGAEPTIGLPTATLASFDEPLAERPKLAVRFASHHEEDDEDEDIERIEIEHAMLESFYGGLEIVEKVGKLAADDDGVVALALTSAEDLMEQDERVELLKRVSKSAPRKSARRLARLQLAEIYAEEGKQDAAREQLEALIFQGE